MEGEVTVICVDTSFASPDTIWWSYDQIRAVELYCGHKLNVHHDNLVDIVTSSQLHFGCLFAPTRNMATVTASLDALASNTGEQVYQCIDLGLLRGFTLFRLGLFPQEDMKKRIVLFSGGSPFSTAGHSPEAMAAFLKEIDGRVALDVIDFGTRVMDKEDYKANYLKALVDAMNDNNENEDSRYILIKDDGLSLSRHISSSLILPPLSYRTVMSLMEGEVTMICVDTSITSLYCFYEQIDAVKIYCERKLKAHPGNLVSIARFGQGDPGIWLDPTNCLGKVKYQLGGLKPRKQEYTDLLEGFKLFRVSRSCEQYMKKRIVAFTGGPLLSTMGQSPEVIALLKKGHVVLDVIDFGTRAKGKEDCREKYLKALVAAINDNSENEDDHYLLIADNGLSLSRQISSSSILPPLVPEEKVPISNTRKKADIQSGGWSSLYYDHLWSSIG